jgi:parallel beta-helix repeat protein
MLYNLYVPSQTAITFANNVKNSTLDCQWYNIGGNGVASTVGIYLTGANNNTINNCNINSFDNGIKILSSSNNVITNVNSYSNSIGIVVTSSSNNAITNCSINGNINNDYYLASSGTSNNFINTNFTDYRTIYFYDTTSWFNYKNATESLSKLGKTAVGGNEFSQSSHSKTASRFQLTQAAHISNITVYMWGDDSLTKALIYGDNNGVPNNLIGSSSEITVGQSFDWYNFTFGVPVYLSPGYYWLTIHHKWNARFKYDIGTTNQAAIQDFNTDNYDDGSSNPFGTTNYADSEISIYATYTADNIWLKTNVSAQAQLTRKLINWNDKLMQWKDTFSNISGSITARYNVTGLVPGAPYSVYNNSFELANSPIKTDSSGALRFTINLPASQEHEIKVVEICDYYLYNSSYLITQSNAYYCLISNVSRLSNSTAINFSSSAQNSTLDCVNNFIRGRSSSYLYGVFSAAYNTTIKNCNTTGVTDSMPQIQATTHYIITRFQATITLMLISILTRTMPI